MLQLHYLQIKRKFTARNINFVTSLFIFAKVAAKWQLLTLFFRKSEGENKSQIATSPGILLTKGKNSVANATVLVAISNPEIVGNFSELSNQRFSSAVRRVLIEATG